MSQRSPTLAALMRLPSCTMRSRIRTRMVLLEAVVRVGGGGEWEQAMAQGRKGKLVQLLSTAMTASEGGTRAEGDLLLPVRGSRRLRSGT